MMEDAVEGIISQLLMMEVAHDRIRKSKLALDPMSVPTIEQAVFGHSRLGNDYGVSSDRFFVLIFMGFVEKRCSGSGEVAGARETRLVDSAEGASGQAHPHVRTSSGRHVGESTREGVVEAC